MNLRCILIDDSQRTFNSWGELFDHRENIKILDCSNNQLTGLPDWFMDLTNLEELNYRNNLLLTFLPQLKQLSEGNGKIKKIYCTFPINKTSVAQMRRFNAFNLRGLLVIDNST